MREMVYTDIICPEYIEEYKKWHKNLFYALSNLVFDISYLRVSYDNQFENRLNIDIGAASVAQRLYKNCFEGAILKLYRYVFDSGKDAISLIRFKNKVKDVYTKKEYRSQVQEAIGATYWMTKEFKTIKVKLELKMKEFRTNLIAHNLDNNELDISITIDELEKIFDGACQLLIALSFSPLDFYNKYEGFGVDFSVERSTITEFIKTYLECGIFNSAYVRNISCEIKEFSTFCGDDVTKLIYEKIADINLRKDNYAKKITEHDKAVI